MNYSTSWAPQALPLSWVTSYAESRDLPTWGRLPSGTAPAQPTFTLAGKKVIIVYNPRAGNGQGELKAQAFRQALEERGKEVLLLETSPDYETTKTRVSTALEYSPADTVVLGISGDGPTGPVADAVNNSRNGIFLPVGGGTTNDLAKFGGTQFKNIKNPRALEAFLGQEFHLQERHLAFISTDGGTRQAVPHTFVWGEAPGLFDAVDNAALAAGRPKRTKDYIVNYLKFPPKDSHYDNPLYRVRGRRLPLGLSAYTWGGMKNVVIEINGKVTHTHATEVVMPAIPLVGGALGVAGGINPAHGQTVIGTLPKNLLRYLGVFGDGTLRALASRLFPNFALGSGSSNTCLSGNQTFSIGPGDHFKITATPEQSRGKNPPTLLNGDPQNNSPNFVEGEMSRDAHFRTLVTRRSQAYRLTAGATQTNFFLASGAFGASLFPTLINLGLFESLGALGSFFSPGVQSAITYGGAFLGNGFFAGLSQIGEGSFGKNFWAHANPLQGGLGQLGKNYILGGAQAKGWEILGNDFLGLFDPDHHHQIIDRVVTTGFTTFMTTYLPMYEATLKKAEKLGASLWLGKAPLRFLQAAPIILGGFSLLASALHSPEKA